MFLRLFQEANKYRSSSFFIWKSGALYLNLTLAIEDFLFLKLWLYRLCNICKYDLSWYWWWPFFHGIDCSTYKQYIDGGPREAKRWDIGKNFSSFFIWLFSSGWWWWLKGHSTAAAKSLVWRHPCHSGSRSSSLYFKHLQLSDCIFINIRFI